MKIGDLAERTGVSRDTLRLYEKRGLIQSVRRSNGYRDFDPAMARLVGLIRQGQQLGFSLAEMQGVVEALSGRDLSAEDTAALFQQKIDEVDVKITQMTSLRGMLAEMMQQACPLRQ